MTMATFSDRELQARHEEVPADYYDRGIAHNLFQRVWHERRIPLIDQFLARRGGRLLDLGCHAGYLTRVIERVSGARVTGIDISNSAISYAQKRLPSTTFVCGDIQDRLPFSDASFETVTAFDVLEHLPHLERTVHEVHRVLVAGGSLIVGVPRETLLFRAVWRLWTRFRGSVWRDVHVHDLNETDLSDIVGRHGFMKERSAVSHWGMYLVIEFEKRQ